MLAIDPTTELSEYFKKSEESPEALRKENEHLRRQIEGLKTKEKEFKNFRSRYQNMVRENELMSQCMDEVERERRRMLRALDDIAAADKTFRRKGIIDYAKKVLAGLGY